MSDTPTDLRHDVALFRYGVIADLLGLPPGSPERGQALRTLLYLFERDMAVRYLRSG